MVMKAKNMVLAVAVVAAVVLLAQLVSGEECSNDQFLFSCAYGKADVVTSCINSGIDIDSVMDDVGCPPMVLAARGGHGEIVGILHRAGAYKRTCNSGYGAVYFARLNGHLDLANHLRVLGASDEDLELSETCSVIDWAHAIRSSNLDDAENCLIHGMKIETEIDGGCKALSVGAFNQQVNSIRFLLARGADPEARCNDGTTALMHAARIGNLEIVKVLVNAGANIEATIKHNSWSALTYAATSGNLHIAKYLHRIEEDFHEKEWQGGPLMWAAATGQAEVIASMLNSLYPSVARQSQRDIHKRDEHGQIALMWAAINGHLDALMVLHKAGSDLNTKTRVGWTPLMAAAYHGHVAIVEYLLRNNVNVNEEDLGGWTALMWATVGGHTTIVKRLLQAGAHTERTFSGWAAILVACATGREEIYNVFLQNGDDIYMTLNDGRNCETLAREGEHYTLADHIMGINAARERYNRHHEELQEYH